jgi:hypothetical protein
VFFGRVDDKNEMFNELIRAMKRLKMIEKRFIEKENCEKALYYANGDGIDTLKVDLEEALRLDLNIMSIKKLFKYLAKMVEMKIVLRKSVNVKGNIFNTQNFLIKKYSRMFISIDDYKKTIKSNGITCCNDPGVQEI